MQVQKVQGNIGFGYNQQLNNDLITRINNAKKNKDVLNALLKLNQLTNETENAIRNAEAAKRYSAVSKLADVFIEMKTCLAHYIELLLPKLKYTETEAVTYAKEAADKEASNPDYWVCDTAGRLFSSLSDNPNSRTVIVGKLPEGMTLDEFAQEYQKKYQEEMAAAGAFPFNDAASSLAAEAESEGRKCIELGKELAIEYIPTEQAKKGFAGLGGMKELKTLLNERIVGALKDPAQAKIDCIEYGKKMPKGILLYGPPGCGKTTIIEHLSTEAGVPLYKVEAGSIGSPYIHETSENIDAVFDYVESKAKDDKPALLFIDDADSLFGNRNEMSGDHHAEEMSSFLNRIQKAADRNVVVAAATNKFDLMDEAIKSRFEEQFFVGLPDKEARKAIVKMFMETRTKGKALAENDEALENIAAKLDLFPIRAIKMIADKASLLALKDGRRDIQVKDFDKIISESGNMKVKSDTYKSKNDMPRIGFNK